MGDISKANNLLYIAYVKQKKFFNRTQGRGFNKDNKLQDTQT